MNVEYAVVCRGRGVPWVFAVCAFFQEFNQNFASGNYKAAARIAATLKSGLLRTAQVIQQFKSVPTQPGQTSAILVYFSTLLDYGTLNAIESIELVRPVALQGRKDFVEKWLNEDKLECTEELGDIVKSLDLNLAVRIYRKAKAGQKVLQALTELGRFEEIIEFAKESRYQTDYSFLLRNLVNVNPENAVKFAQQLLACEPPLVDISQVVDILLQQHRLQELTSLLLDYLKGNKPEHSALQTRLLEVNLLHSPQVAETIFQMDMLTHFDKPKIAALCEKAGLYQRALELYTDVQDIKRVMLQGGGKLNQEWTQQFFGSMAPDTCLEILTDMLRSSSQNLQAVVAVAIKFHTQIGTSRLIEMFEKFSSYEGIFYFLGSILAFSTDPEVHFKYIEAAAKLNHTQEVERVCRESKCYEPVRVKDFLKVRFSLSSLSPRFALRLSAPQCLCWVGGGLVSVALSLSPSLFSPLSVCTPDQVHQQRPGLFSFLSVVSKAWLFLSSSSLCEGSTVSVH